MEIPLEGLDENEINSVCEIFRSGKHTMGRYVAEFESNFAEYLGVKHAVMVNSGSSANLLALEVLTRGMQTTLPKNSIIAVPAVLWPTSLWPIIQLGFRVLLIDTLPNSLEIDFDQLVRARQEFGDVLAGAVLIHPLGKSLPLNRIQELQDEFGMVIIEDNCESLGSGNNEKYSGTVGNFGTFSFYFSHHITTVEGGMVVTNNDVYANDLKSMRAHGWTRNRSDEQDWTSKYPDIKKDFLFVTSGYNFRPMEFQGALGSSQLRKLKSFVDTRIDIASRVNNAINKDYMEIIGFEPSDENSLKRYSRIPANSWMALPIIVNPKFGKPQQVQEKLALNGIHSRPILAGNFVNQPAGRHPDILSYGNLENAHRTYGSGFMIGNHHAYAEDQISYLCEILKSLEL